MGASDFGVTVRTTEDARKAFLKATSDARHEYGHGGYTGTIAEKTDFKVLARCEEKDLATTGQRFEEETDDKWGPAGAIELLKDGKRIGWHFFGWASC